MKILVTAFEPFGSDKVNPTEQILKQLPDEIGGASIEKLLLPVTFGSSLEIAAKEIEKLRPDAVVSLGLAGGRNAITPERIAINIADARIPDNDGAQPIDKPIFADGDAAYFSTLPIRKIVDRLNDEKIPASISNTAGTYVCNQIMYGVLHYIKKNALNMCAGFIHVPYSDEMEHKNDMPSLPLCVLVKGITLAIQIIADK